MFGSRIVENAIRISTGFDVAAHFQSLEVKYHGLVCAAIADESPAEIGDERDAMHSFQIRDTANGGAAIGVHDFHFGVVRNVETACRGVKCDVIPVFFSTGGSAKFVFPQQVIAALRGSCKYKTAEQQGSTAHSQAA